MLKTVLVGCGSQGLRHLRCLGKIRKTLNIEILALVDPYRDRTSLLGGHLRGLGFDADRVVHDNDLASLATKVDLSEAVVDVVTTNCAHHEIATIAAEHGAKGIILEKPIADTLDHARAITELAGPIYVLENYLFSSITRFAKDYLGAHPVTPCFAKTEFSKDRRMDSANGRGMGDHYTPHVFAVEMPHQVAIMSHLLGSPRAVSDSWCNDMILPDGRISDHGEGAITLQHEGGVTSYNFSCLQGHHHSSTTYRTVRIYCDDLTKVVCYYPATMDLTGSVLIYRGDEMVESHTLLDDSLTESLKYTLLSCREGQRAVNHAQFGYDIMDVIDTGKRLAREYV
jgi:predicted dehydrogenase